MNDSSRFIQHRTWPQQERGRECCRRARLQHERGQSSTERAYFGEERVCNTKGVILSPSRLTSEKNVAATRKEGSILHRASRNVAEERSRNAKGVNLAPSEHTYLCFRRLRLQFSPARHGLRKKKRAYADAALGTNFAHGRPHAPETPLSARPKLQTLVVASPAAAHKVYPLWEVLCLQ